MNRFHYQFYNNWNNPIFYINNNQYFTFSDETWNIWEHDRVDTVLILQYE